MSEYKSCNNCDNNETYYADSPCSECKRNSSLRIEDNWKKIK